MSSQRAVPVSPVWWHSLRAWSGQKGNVFGVLFSGSDLHTLVQGRSSQQSNVVCFDCKGKQRCCMCNGGQGCSSTWVHPLCPQLHREGCVKPDSISQVCKGCWSALLKPECKTFVIAAQRKRHRHFCMWGSRGHRQIKETQNNSLELMWLQMDVWRELHWVPGAF